MQIGKFVLSFVMIFPLLMLIVWAGTAFDNEMTFTWYSYTIVSIFSTFYAWTRSLNMNKIADEKPATKKTGHNLHLPANDNHS